MITHSHHWLSDASFAAAVGDWCTQERAATASYRQSVLAHSPYRDDDPPAPAAG